MTVFPVTVVHAANGVAANGGTTTTDVILLDVAHERVQAYVASDRTFVAWLEYSVDGVNWVTLAHATSTDATADSLWRYIAHLMPGNGIVAGVRVRVRVRNTDTTNNANIRVLLVATEM